MHSCLLLNEILSVIFEHFFVTADASTLAALARTCHTFTEPALDVLWRELATLSPLLQCLSSDLWVLQKGKQSGRKELCFRKPLLDADWTRFNYYKGRIRTLGQTVFRSGNACWYDVCTQTLRELSFYQHNTLLLPNLHSLNFRMLPPDAVPFARLFLGPSVAEVTISITSEDAESAIEVLSSLIPLLSPDILRLNIWSITGITRPCSAIFQLIQDLRNLRTLNIDLKHRGLHERVTPLLGGLSSLDNLKMSLIQANHIPFYTTALGQFPLLTKFSFVVDDWASAATIMDSMDCRFTYLAVTTQKEGTLSDLRTFNESIFRHRSVSSLSHLSLIDFETTLSDADDNESYVEDVFRPLFALVSLKHINLQFDVSANLRDSWYNDAAANWPCLESMSISSPNMGPIKAKMTLAGLIPLVKHCMKLESVRLRVDAQPFDPTQVEEVSNTNIQKLCLETYIIPSPGEVFNSLIRIFPNLEYVYQGSRFRASLSWPWDDVNYMLHASAVRRRGQCVNKGVACTCETADSQAQTVPLKTRPQIPGSSQLREFMDIIGQMNKDE